MNTNDRIFGTVARWHPARGFGCVKADVAGERYFCHFNNIRNAPGVDELPRGQRVSFVLGTDRRTGRGKCILVDVIGELLVAREHRALADHTFMGTSKNSCFSRPVRI